MLKGENITSSWVDWSSSASTWPCASRTPVRSGKIAEVARIVSVTWRVMTGPDDSRKLFLLIAHIFQLRLRLWRSAAFNYVGQFRRSSFHFSAKKWPSLSSILMKRNSSFTNLYSFESFFSSLYVYCDKSCSKSDWIPYTFSFRANMSLGSHPF